MILSKNQLDMFYDTISQSSPSRMVEEKIKKAWSIVTRKVTELLQDVYKRQILDNAFVVDTTGLTNLRATALKIAKKASPVKSDKKI